MVFGLGIGQVEEDIKPLLGAESTVVGLVGLVGLLMRAMDGYNPGHKGNVPQFQP
jgi:hypothetical protein